MVTINYISKVYNILNEQEHRITVSPVKKGNFFMYCNNHLIGGLFDDELYFVYCKVAEDFLNNLKLGDISIVVNESHRMLHIPFDHAKELLDITYKDRFDGLNYVANIACHFESNSSYPEHIQSTYDNFVIFLKFCNSNKMLKRNPLDLKDRVVKFSYINSDLKPKGVLYFYPLLNKFYSFLDKAGKSDLEKMLKKWLDKLESDEAKKSV